MNRPTGDTMLQLRQVLRDRGASTAALRQMARMAARLVGRWVPGYPVDGIRRWPDRDFSLAVPFGFIDGATRPGGWRIVAMCHVFYPELAGEFRADLAHIPGALDVILTTDSEAKAGAIAAAFAGWDKGKVELRVLPNRGRDIQPKITTLEQVRRDYDLVLYLHTKRSVRRLEDGALSDDRSDWRRYLVHNLTGSPAIAASILEAFRHDPRLGLVMPQHWFPIREFAYWRTGEFALGQTLARRMGVRLTPLHVLDFPSGSMFWARTAALAPIASLGLGVEDFDVEAGQVEGTLAHALERLMLFACEAAGYRWLKVCDPALTTLPATVIPIDTPAALDGWWRRHGYRLTTLAPN